MAPGKLFPSLGRSPRQAPDPCPRLPGHHPPPTRSSAPSMTHPCHAKFEILRGKVGTGNQSPHYDLASLPASKALRPPRTTNTTSGHRPITHPRLGRVRGARGGLHRSWVWRYCVEPNVMPYPACRRTRRVPHSRGIRGSAAWSVFRCGFRWVWVVVVVWGGRCLEVRSMRWC